jgi:hypothetical protein
LFDQRRPGGGGSISTRLDTIRRSSVSILPKRTSLTHAHLRDDPTRLSTTDSTHACDVNDDNDNPPTLGFLFFFPTTTTACTHPRARARARSPAHPSDRHLTADTSTANHLPKPDAPVAGRVVEAPTGHAASSSSSSSRRTAADIDGRRRHKRHQHRPRAMFRKHSRGAQVS